MVENIIDLTSEDTPTDTSSDLHSVRHLIYEAEHSRHASRSAPVPAPKELRKKSSELKTLRQAEVWLQGDRGLQVVQMAEWFPSIPHAREDGVVYGDVKPIKTEATTVVMKKEPADDFITSPTSNIGIFAQIPGELRNRINRYAVIQPEPGLIKVAMPPFT
jgi:hypothetical protein